MVQVDARHAALFMVVACLVGAIFGSAVTFAVLQRSYSISNVAQVKAVGVEIYSDAQLSVLVSRIDWGVVEPGGSKSFVAYVKNSGNSPVFLSLQASDWQPSNASLVMHVSWDVGNASLDAGRFVVVTFKLVVDSAVLGIDVFAFTIVVTGSG